jgi:hypothetical protein
MIVNDPTIEYAVLPHSVGRKVTTGDETKHIRMGSMVINVENYAGGILKPPSDTMPLLSSFYREITDTEWFTRKLRY